MKDDFEVGVDLVSIKDQFVRRVSVRVQGELPDRFTQARPGEISRGL